MLAIARAVLRKPSHHPGTAVDVKRLPGDEVARARGEEHYGADQILRMLVALEGARLAARRKILLRQHAPLVLVGDGEAGRDGVDVDPVVAYLARERARESNHCGF